MRIKPDSPGNARRSAPLNLSGIERSGNQLFPMNFQFYKDSSILLFKKQKYMSEARTPMQVKRELKARMKDLKPMLHRGAHGEIANKLKISKAFVSEVVAGRRWDLNVIEALIEVGETNLKRAIRATKKIDRIVSESGKATQG